MIKVGLLIRVEAKAGKADEVEAMLTQAFAEIQHEKPTLAWFALRLGPTSFAVLDAFADEEGRQAHIAAHLDEVREAAPLLFAGDPAIEYADVIAAKVPAA